MRWLLILTLVSQPFLISCANRLILHPITGEDIYDGKNAGDKCFSAFYLQEVINAKIEARR